MKFTSALLTAASGSIGGMTASHNRGGAYLRARVIPVNPNTARQGEARANMAQASGAWSNILSAPQREAWTAYALSTPTVDALGAQLVLSGQQMFIKSALPRLIAGLALVLPGPTTSGLATTPTFAADPTLEEGGPLAGTVNVEGAGVTGDVIFYMSQPTPTSRSVAQAKRAFAGIDGPPVAGAFAFSFASAALPWETNEGLQTRITAVYLGDDGRVSAEAFRDILITAP